MYCCLIGPEPHELPFGYDTEDERYLELRRRLSYGIQELYYRENVRWFGSGMTQGFGLWAAEAVLELKRQGLEIELKAYSYEGMSDPWPSEQRERLYELLAQPEVSYEEGTGAKRTREQWEEALVERATHAIYMPCAQWAEWSSRAGHPCGLKLLNPMELLGFTPRPLPFGYAE